MWRCRMKGYIFEENGAVLDKEYVIMLCVGTNGKGLLAFIAPRELNEREEIRLAELGAQEEYVLYAKGTCEL